MRPSESPFPSHWWGVGLADAGLESERPDVGTYGEYDSAPLPTLPFEMRGDLDWLTNAQPYESHIGEEKLSENQAALGTLLESARSLGVELPEAFLKFVRSPDLQERVRSCTDCFLDVCPELVPSPLGGGYLVRFLADSQGCVFWYLYLTSDGRDHAVVSSVGFYGSEAERWEEEADPGDISFSEESFESFICRFWLENEIWFAQHENTALSAFGAQYIEAYRRYAQSLPAVRDPPE